MPRALCGLRREADGGEPAGEIPNRRKPAQPVHFLAEQRIGADATGEEKHGAGVAGITECLRREQLETLVVTGVGKQAALDQDPGLVGELGHRARNGGDLRLPGSQAIATVSAAHEQRPQQDGDGRRQLRVIRVRHDPSRQSQCAGGRGQDEERHEHDGVVDRERSDLLVGRSSIQGGDGQGADRPSPTHEGEEQVGLDGLEDARGHRALHDSPGMGHHAEERRHRCVPVVRPEVRVRRPALSAQHGHHVPVVEAQVGEGHDRRENEEQQAVRPRHAAKPVEGQRDRGREQGQARVLLHQHARQHRGQEGGARAAQPRVDHPGDEPGVEHLGMEAVVQRSRGVVVEHEGECRRAGQGPARSQPLRDCKHVQAAGDDGDDGKRMKPQRAGMKSIRSTDDQHPPVRMVRELASIGEPGRVRGLDEQRAAMDGLEAGAIVVDGEINGVDLPGSKPGPHVPEEQDPDDERPRPYEATRRLPVHREERRLPPVRARRHQEGQGERRHQDRRETHDTWPTHQGRADQYDEHGQADCRQRDGRATYAHIALGDAANVERPFDRGWQRSGVMGRAGLYRNWIQSIDSGANKRASRSGTD